MTTEYSISVVDWNDGRWDHVGVNVMYEYYQRNKETRREARSYGIDPDDYAREKADENFPCMLYAYPIYGEPSDDKIRAVCLNTCLTVVQDVDTDDYYLALCGGGMNLSQSIAMAYIIVQGWIPHALAREIERQPCLSVGPRQWKRIAKEVMKDLKSEIRASSNELKRWRSEVKDFENKESVSA